MQREYICRCKTLYTIYVLYAVSY